jgi:hypothetical protein
MATKTEIETAKRKLRRESEEEARRRPNWTALAKKSNKGLRKSRAGKKRQDALDMRLPGSGWTKNA